LIVELGIGIERDGQCSRHHLNAEDANACKAEKTHQQKGKSADKENRKQRDNKKGFGLKGPHGTVSDVEHHRMCDAI
jgi:hypothetical protein